MEEEEITHEKDMDLEDPEMDLTIDQVISSKIINLIDEREDIIFIDTASIHRNFLKIRDITTIKKLTMIENLESDLVKSIDMFDEELRSTNSSSNFLNITKSLLSNTEIDYYKIFERLENV